ncbi:hypothetical protein D3C78_599620 [compost metagenome]
MRNGDRVRAEGVGGRQAPDGVGVTGQVGGSDVLLVDVRLVAVEVQGQRLVVGDRVNVVHAQVVLLQYIFNIGGVQGSRQVFGELVAAAEYVDRLQATAVTAFSTLAGFLGETTGVQFQALDLLGGDQGTGVAFWQQATVVVLQHWQFRHLVTVLQYSVGDAEFNCCATTGQIVRGVLLVGWRVAVRRLEEVDTATAVAAFTTVQTHSVQTESVDTDTNGALGVAGGELADEGLAPLALVFGVVLLVTVDEGVAQQNAGFAVFYEALGFGLVIGHSLSRCHKPQRDQTDPGFQHFIFLIT